MPVPNIFNSQNLEHAIRARFSQISNQNNISVFYEYTLLREYYKTFMMITIYHTYDES